MLLQKPLQTAPVQTHTEHTNLQCTLGSKSHPYALMSVLHTETNVVYWEKELRIYCSMQVMLQAHP